MFVKRIPQLMDPLCVNKQRRLQKLLVKKISVQLMDGWFNRRIKRKNIVYKHIHVEGKSADFVAVDVWINTVVKNYR